MASSASEGMARSASLGALLTSEDQSRDRKDDDEDEDDEYDSDADFSHGDVHDGTIKKAWGHYRGTNDLLLFGSRDTSVDLSALHP